MTELITFHHPKHGDIYVVESTELCSPYFIADQVIKLVGPLEGDADPDEFIHTDVWHQVPEFVQLYAEGLCYSNNFKFPNKLISGLCFLRLCKNSVNKKDAYEIFEWIDTQRKVHNKNGSSIYEIDDFRDWTKEDDARRKVIEDDNMKSKLLDNCKRLIKNNDKLYQRILKLKARVKELESKLNIISEDGE